MALRTRVAPPPPPADVPIVFASSRMREVVASAIEVAPTDAKVLLGGESGVGKDVLARLIHQRSQRSQRPLVTVNCAAVSDTLLESELFGHLRGSFTGAYRDRAGLLQIAHTGTIFMDEVGEMSPRMQALLLRFLENGEVQPLGADGPRARSDVRVIAASNHNLEERVASGHFRGDLLYRLRVVYLQVPPLRERKDDIPVLVEHFLGAARHHVRVADTTMQLLLDYPWPGNVRELRNVVEGLIALSRGGVLEPEHLPVRMRVPAAAPSGNAERRRQVSDELYHALVSGRWTFWEHVHPLFLARDLTRQDIRELVRRGLSESRGNYRALVRLFRLPRADYKRFLNFLMTHDCAVDFRPFRNGELPARTRMPSLLPSEPPGPRRERHDH